MTEPLLQLDRASIRFGGLTAVADFSLTVHANELVGLIGPNGAGKTTAFNMITGVYQPTSGSIEFAGKRIKGLKPHDLTRLGIAGEFQQPNDASHSLDRCIMSAEHRHDSRTRAAARALTRSSSSFKYCRH